MRPALMPTFRSVRLSSTIAAKIFCVTRAALLDLLEDALVNQIEKLRHDGESRDVALLQRLQQFGGVEGFQVYDSRSLDQRQEQVRHLRQHVEQGQDAEQRVSGAEIDPVEDGVHFAEEVGVRQHHAFGISRCA